MKNPKTRYYYTANCADSMGGGGFQMQERFLSVLELNCEKKPFGCAVLQLQVKE